MSREPCWQRLLSIGLRRARVIVCFGSRAGDLCAGVPRRTTPHGRKGSPRPGTAGLQGSRADGQWVVEATEGLQVLGALVGVEAGERVGREWRASSADDRAEGGGGDW